MAPDTWIFLNRAAGSADGEDAPAQIEAAFREAGHPARIEVLETPSELGDRVRAALRAGARRVVAGGGDGTLRTVAEVLAGSDAAFGVLPAGTLNHFARDLDIPLDLAAAAGIAATGREALLDVAEVNGRVFVNNSALGLYSRYRLEKQEIKKLGWQGKLAALWAAVRTIARYPALHLRFFVQGSEMLRRTPYVLIANNEHAMEGFPVWQRDRLTEGHLWIYVLRDRSRWGLLRLLLRYATGAFRAVDEFEVFRAPEVVISARTPHLVASLDGEMFHLESPLHYRCRPRALRTIVPRGGRREREAGTAREEALSER